MQINIAYLGVTRIFDEDGFAILTDMEVAVYVILLYIRL